MAKYLSFIISFLFVNYNIAFCQFTESNLPILIIKTTTNISNEPKVTGTIEVLDTKGQINKITDKPTAKYTIGIEYRGSSSQDFPKKSFGFETRNEKGENLNISLLGLPADNDWVIIAPYSDKSLFRDPLSYSLFRKTGRYASKTIFVEVVVNGNYYGVCFLGEKLKQGIARVNISDLKTIDNTGDELTGGYLLKLDKTTGALSKSWSSNFSANSSKPLFQVEYPKYTDLTTPQYNYIKNYIFDFEERLVGANFKDEEKGYKKVIDIDSFVDYFLLSEITRNVDGYRLSTYLYKDKDSKNGKLTMGPAWDYNLAFGNADYCQGWSTTGWAFMFNDVCPGDHWGVPFWWGRFIQDGKFQAKLKSRWKDLRANVWSNKNIVTEIDSMANLLKDAQARNFKQWPILGKYVWPNKYIANSYADEIDYFKKWIENRLTWMDATDLLNSNLLAQESPTIDSERLLVYPNPIMASSKISFGILNSENISVNIYDFSGKKLQKIVNQKMQKGIYEFHINSSNLLPGIYFVKLEKSNKGASIQKIIVN